MKRRIAPILGLALLTAGCWPMFDPAPREQEPRQLPEIDRPPSVESIEVPTFPPLGPNGVVVVKASDDEGLAWIGFSFLKSVTRQVSGSFVTATVTGAELGEGFGTLVVSARDSQGGTAERKVESLLVDLSPPEITVDRTVVRGSSEGTGTNLEMWVADAWMLGRVELVFQGVSVSHTFPEAYPPTLGEEWDVSLIKFPASSLPEGAGPATVRAFDAAGNEATASFELVVDSTAPRIFVLSPEPNTVVSQEFDVELRAMDSGGGPVWIEVAVGGVVLAEAIGPAATLRFDASEIAPGHIDLEATAVDEAGNRSESILIPLTIAE